MEWQTHVETLKGGNIAQFRPKGNSMKPRIKSGQLVTVSPATEYSKGDIVFCKVNGHFYVHLVLTVQGERLQIGNNGGHVNGWTTSVYGKVTKIDD